MASHMAATNDKSISGSSRSSSDVTVFGIEENEENRDLRIRSSELIGSTNSQKLKLTHVRDNSWNSYYHFVIAMVLVNSINYWIPEWLHTVNMMRSLLIVHFFLIMVFIHLPINYAEMLLAIYTKEPPINLWKVCPIFIGYCYSVLVYSTLQSWLDANYCGRTLLYLMETIFDRAPWLRCPPSSGNECLTLTRETKLSKDCRIAENSTQIWCPERGNFDFSANYWFKLRFRADSHDKSLKTLDTHWRIILCIIAHWIFVLMSVMRSVYKFGTTIYCVGATELIFALMYIAFILFSVNLTEFVKIALQPPQFTDFVNAEYWAVAYVSTIWRAHVTTPPLIMTYISRIDSKFDVAWCAVIITCASFFMMMFKSTISGGLLIIFAKQLGVGMDILVQNSLSNGLTLVPQHLGTMPMPLMWTFFWFAMRYAIFWLRSTMVVQLVLENFLLKYNVRKEFRIYFISIFCMIGCIGNIIVIIRGTKFIKVLSVHVMFTDMSLLPVIESIFIFLIYGLTTFVNDIHFTFGSPPSFFWRFCWKTLPFTSLTLYVVSISTNLFGDSSPLETHFFLIKIVLAAIIPVFALKQIMYAVYNENLAYLFNPVFDWGPSDKEVRKARKRFNPKTDIRSQPERTIGYVKPRESGRDLTIE